MDGSQRTGNQSAAAPRPLTATEQNVLQALLLHESLQEGNDEEGDQEPSAEELGTSAVDVSFYDSMRSTFRSTLRSTRGGNPATTLRGLRRAGPLAGLSAAGYATFMGSTLYEYDEAAEGSLSSSASPRGTWPGADLAETLQMLQTAMMGSSSEDVSSASDAYPWPPADSPTSDSGHAGIPPGPSGFTARSAFWRTGHTALGGTVASTNSYFSATGDALGGDGIETFDMHALLRRMLHDGEITTSLAEQAHRMLQLGSVASGQRLSDEEIEALPKVRFEEAEQQTCAICLDVYQQGELLTALQCHHFFHVACLARWFQRSTQCPLCRSSQRAE